MSVTSGAEPTDPFGLRDDKSYRIRLGRYEGSSPAPPPYNEILIGRRKVRRDYLDWLRKRARAGALLITGARGAGKSTFVRACLDDYEGDPFPRLQRLGPTSSLVVHARFWLLFVYNVLLLPLIAALAAVVTLQKFTPRTLLGWLLAVPFLYMALAPYLAVFQRRKVEPASPDRATSREPGGPPETADARDRPSRIERWFSARPEASWWLPRLSALFPTIWILVAPWCMSDGSLPTIVIVVAGGIGALVSSRGEWLGAASRSSRGETRRASVVESLAAHHHPLLRIHVNLGFDNLDHPAVTRSMLTGLRGAHARQFLARWSLSSLQHTARVLFHVLILTGIVSKVSDFLAPQLDEVELLKRSREVALEAPLPFRGLPWDVVVRTKTNGEDPPQIAISFGDLGIFALLLVLRRIAVAPGIADYHRRLSRKMAATLERLDSSARFTRSRKVKLEALQNVAGAVKSFLPGLTVEGNHEVALESSKLDPRQVELAFVDILERIATPRPTRTWLDFLFLVPSAEIVFVFDELDKVGSHPRFLEGVGTTPRQTSYFSSDRNQQVHRLLSDMKNLLGTAHARFVFIGGRDLDDEWLADRTARNPLLSTIFDDCFYVPSIFHFEEWHGGSEKKAPEIGEGLLRNIRELVLRHIDSAKGRNNPSSRGRREKTTWAPSVPEATPLEKAASEKAASGKSESEVLEAWLPYLAVASRGNVKRLEELFSHPASEYHGVPEQYLIFKYSQRYIAGLHKEIFGHVAPLIEVRQEDKVVQSAFYLTEFLFKFHRRAFHWSNLELLEEIVDVHHAPDVRDFFAKLVQAWSQSYLAPIESGMYSFRFDSAVAAEIRYACRISEFSMAAFNFALDETYLLKQEHERRLEAVLQRHDESYYSRTVLGELFDFEEDFERARLHYAAAIRCLDSNLKEDFDGKALSLAGVDMTKIMSQDQAQIDWIILRLFNKLRLGLTYEKTGDYTDAMLHYTNARTLAETAVQNICEGSDVRWYETSKALQLLFQPLFACAWIAEKCRSPASASAIVESGIEAVRKVAVKNGADAPIFSPLIDLHRSAGALYLARGAHYLEKAHEHFAAAVTCSVKALMPGQLETRDTAVAHKIGSRLAASALSLADVHLANTDVGALFSSLADQGLDNLGARPTRAKIFSEAKPLGKPSGIGHYLLLGSEAIGVMKDCGLEERSRWEQLRQLDVLAGVIWSGRVHRWLKEIDERNGKQPLPPFPDLDSSVCGAIDGYMKQVRSNERIGSVHEILRHAETRSCLSLVLSFHDIGCGDCEKDRLDTLGLLEKQPFPVFIVLARARDYVRRTTMEAISNRTAHVSTKFLDELIRLTDSYDSSIHFTHYSLGSTLAFWVIANGMTGSPVSSAMERIGKRALVALDKSIGAVSELPEYVVTIAKQHYLEDAFNDRSFQTGQAFQTFGRALAIDLRKRVRAILDLKVAASDEHVAEHGKQAPVQKGVRNPGVPAGPFAEAPVPSASGEGVAST